MTLHVLPLEGCGVSPFAFYLKSLGALRLVAEQVDPTARGFFSGDLFHLISSLSADALSEFFVGAYSPTPMLSPWNGGSGFYDGDNVPGLDKIEASDDPRFERFREAIRITRSIPLLPPRGATLGRLVEAARAYGSHLTERKAEELRSRIREIEALESPTLKLEELPSSRDRNRAKKFRTSMNKLARDTLKPEIIAQARATLPSLEWIDAVVVLTHDGEPGYPPLLGTAGNEGRLDYTKIFMGHLATLLLGSDPQGCRELLESALRGTPTDRLVGAPFGQLLPGRAGGFNQREGLEKAEDVPVNPWDYVLALEGAMLWSSATARVSGASAGRAASPFTVLPSSVGYPSAAEAGKGRAEIWAPIWRRPASLAEVRALLREGRAQVGRRRARTALDLATAASSLGVSRGLVGFERFALLKRRGDSYVAVSAGRFRASPREVSAFIAQLDPLLAQLDRFLRGFKQVPASLATARRGLDQSIFEALERGRPRDLAEVVASLGRIERLLAVRDPGRSPSLRAPLGGLSPRWVLAADDGSLELRVAAALASIGPTAPVGPLRANLSPVDPSRPTRWASGTGQRFWAGRDLSARLAGVLGRRLLDAERLGTGRNPTWGRLGLIPEDVAGFLAGRVNEERLEDLLFGWSLVDWTRHELGEVRAQVSRRWSQPTVRGVFLVRVYCLLALLVRPGPVREVNVRPEPALLPLLLAGRVAEAARLAQRRLRAAGLPVLEAAFPERSDGTRLAAALLLPLRSSGALEREVFEETLSSGPETRREIHAPAT